jgi:hypothetical protein
MVVIVSPLCFAGFYHRIRREQDGRSHSQLIKWPWQIAIEGELLFPFVASRLSMSALARWTKPTAVRIAAGYHAERRRTARSSMQLVGRAQRCAAQYEKLLVARVWKETRVSVQEITGSISPLPTGDLLYFSTSFIYA